ncbi:hypothetical protein F2Q70_00022236 [Brassica cretica]|uniref:Uncharacterized protein n=1 Tax=Brassica cretica TaxID=69181 RepID=A0A8S9GNE7_BRACR|nr:hypothetical protein F2Q70_00022236 [Brassica cretica]
MVPFRGMAGPWVVFPSGVASPRLSKDLVVLALLAARLLRQWVNMTDLWTSLDTWCLQCSNFLLGSPPVFIGEEALLQDVFFPRQFFLAIFYFYFAVCRWIHCECKRSLCSLFISKFLVVGWNLFLDPAFPSVRLELPHLPLFWLSILTNGPIGCGGSLVSTFCLRAVEKRPNSVPFRGMAGPCVVLPSGGFSSPQSCGSGVASSETPPTVGEYDGPMEQLGHLVSAM